MVGKHAADAAAAITLCGIPLVAKGWSQDDVEEAELEAAYQPGPKLRSASRRGTGARDRRQIKRGWKPRDYPMTLFDV